MTFVLPPDAKRRPTAEVLTDSISPNGNRVTTFRILMHRFVLTHFLTHRVASRSAASDRAISSRVRLEQVISDPAMPAGWPSEAKGMQGGDPLLGEDLDDAVELFEAIHAAITGLIGGYLDRKDAQYGHLPLEERRTHVLHKSVLNRPMETFMWQWVVASFTDLQGFFDQRAGAADTLAQLEIALPADAMKAAFEASTPTPLGFDEWHLPFIDDGDREWAHRSWRGRSLLGVDVDATGVLKGVSSARCARTSLENIHGDWDPEGDWDLYRRLVAANPLHASPMEHICTPATDVEIAGHEVLGNLRTFHQHRHEVEAAKHHAAIAA